MPIFVKLPSGVTVNLASINSVVPTSEGGATVHFDQGGTASLSPQDATALQKRMGGTQLSSNVKTAIFWLVILVAVMFVFLAVHSGRPRV